MLKKKEMKRRPVRKRQSLGELQNANDFAKNSYYLKSNFKDVGDYNFDV